MPASVSDRLMQPRDDKLYCRYVDTNHYDVLLALIIFNQVFECVQVVYLSLFTHAKLLESHVFNLPQK